MSKDGGEGGGGNKPEMPGEKKEDPFESGKHRQAIRVMTVMAYMFAVSSMGMTLSGYYLFLWQPPDPKQIAHNRVQNPLKQIADEPVALALKTSPIEEPVILVKRNKTRIYSTPKPPAHDFETFSRANFNGDIILRKLTSRSLTKDQLDSIGINPSETESASLKLKLESTSETPLQVTDKEGAIEAGQARKPSVLSKVLGTFSIDDPHPAETVKNPLPQGSH